MLSEVRLSVMGALLHLAEEAAFPHEKPPPEKQSVTTILTRREKHRQAPQPTPF